MAAIVHMMHSMHNGTKEGYEAMQKRLTGLFDAVLQPGQHWKDAIDATMPVEKALALVGVLPTAPASVQAAALREAENALKEAVEHFTGTAARVTYLTGPDRASWKSIRVEAPGYRAGPAGDH